MLAVTTSPQKSSKPQPRDSPTKNHKHSFDCFQEQHIETAGAPEWNFRSKFLALTKAPCGTTGKAPFPLSTWIPSPVQQALFLPVCSSYKAVLAGIIFSRQAQKPSRAGLWCQAGPSHWLCNTKSKQSPRLSSHQSLATAIRQQMNHSFQNTAPKLEPGNNLRD